MLNELDAYELAEWMAFERIEPFGSMWEDYRSAFQTANIVSAHCVEGTRLKIKDFMPNQKKRYMTDEEMKKRFGV